MVIYGEYLFLENFITGMLIIYFTMNFYGLPAKKLRIVLGSTLCGIYAFIIFVSIHPAIALVSKLFFSALVVAIVFGFKGAKKFFQTIILFYIISFAMGGVTIGALYLFNYTGITSNTAVYMGGITYMNITLGILLFYLLASYFYQIIKVKRSEQRVFVKTKICIEGHEWEYNSLIDSGNFLKDPMSERPVIVIEEEAAKTIIHSIKDKNKRYCLIPFQTVGVKTGFMEGYRLDRLIVDNMYIDKAIMAIYKGAFYKKNGQKYQILLHQEMLERGIITDAGENI